MSSRGTDELQLAMNVLKRTRPYLTENELRILAMHMLKTCKEEQEETQRKTLSQLHWERVSSQENLHKPKNVLKGNSSTPNSKAVPVRATRRIDNKENRSVGTRDYVNENFYNSTRSSVPKYTPPNKSLSSTSSFSSDNSYDSYVQQNSVFKKPLPKSQQQRRSHPNCQEHAPNCKRIKLMSRTSMESLCSRSSMGSQRSISQDSQSVYQNKRSEEFLQWRASRLVLNTVTKKSNTNLDRCLNKTASVPQPYKKIEKSLGDVKTDLSELEDSISRMTILANKKYY